MESEPLDGQKAAEVLFFSEDFYKLKPVALDAGIANREHPPVHNSGTNCPVVNCLGAKAILERPMKKLILLVPFLLAAAACTPTQQGAVIGGASGAAIGTAVAGDDLEGAIIGGAVGSVAGALIGRAAENSQQCIYRDEYGRRYTARCPRGY